MSFIPFTTEWVGLFPLEITSIFAYGLVLFFCGASYVNIQNEIIREKGKESEMAKK